MLEMIESFSQRKWYIWRDFQSKTPEKLKKKSQFSRLFEYALRRVLAFPFLEITKNIKSSVDDMKDLTWFADGLQEK